MSETTRPGRLLSQATAANTILLFRTERYDVRIYRAGDQTLMNVYDARFDINRLVEGATQFTILNGMRTYISTGSFSGAQARYEVSITREDDEARLLIRNGSGELIANETSAAVDIARLPQDLILDSQDSILRFDTTTFAVNVFERGEQRFMNVFNKFTGVTNVNGQAASLAPSEPPYENAISYVSSATWDGQPVEYFARIDNSGATTLEVFNINKQPFFRESGEGPTVINIPQDDLETIADARNISASELDGFMLSDANENIFVAGVFGQDENELLPRVQGLFPEAFIVDARQGKFIHAGSFASRDAANARVFELRSRGFNARVVFREGEFR